MRFATSSALRLLSLLAATAKMDALRISPSSIVASGATPATGTAPTKADFMLKTLPAAKGSFLLHTWGQAAQTVRANGFSPATEAVGDGAFRMKALSEALPKLVAQAKIIGLAENSPAGSFSFDKLDEPHRSNGERLSRPKLVGALSAGKGSAVALVSEWEDHVSIDACAVNPTFMVLGEGAEAVLLQHIVDEAAERGIDDVRLVPSYQVDGDEFYARIGFHPMDGEDGVMCYRKTIR